MPPDQVWTYLRRWFWLAILGLLAGAAAALAISTVLPRTYTASTRLLVTAGDSATLTGGTMTPDQVLTTYAQILRSRPVVEAALAEAGASLSYEDAVRALDITPVRGTQIIELTVRTGDPESAAGLANQLAVAAVSQARAAQASQFAARRAQVADAANQLAAEVANRAQQLEDLRSQSTDVSDAEVAATQAVLADAELRYAAAVRGVGEQDLAATRNSDPLSSVEPALPPTGAGSPRLALNVAVGAVLGLVIALAAATVLQLLRDPLSTPDEVRQRIGLPVWAVMPRTRAVGDQHAREAFRALRTSLQQALSQRPMALQVTTCWRGEGATTTAVGVATAWAHAGERVVLVDANVQASAIGRLFGLESTPDVGLLLASEPTLDLVANALRPTSIAGLQVISFGTQREPVRDLLASRRMAALIDQLRTLADRVVIDCPPVSASETLAIAQGVDAILLVVDGRHSRGRDVARTASTLRAATAAVLGIALNQAPRSRRRVPVSSATGAPAGLPERQPGVV